MSDVRCNTCGEIFDQSDMSRHECKRERLKARISDLEARVLDIERHLDSMTGYAALPRS